MIPLHGAVVRIARTKFAISILLLAIGLAGCGGGDDDDPPAPPPEPTANPPETPPANPPPEEPPPEEPPPEEPPPEEPPPTDPPPAEEPPLPPLATPATPIDNVPVIGTVHWPDGDTPDGGQGQEVMGLQCAEPITDYHVHAHLAIFLNGEQLAVPQNIGIVPTSPGENCYYLLHTHDASGMLHVEGPEPTTYTLGQFFAVWGQPLERSNVAGLSGLPVVVYVTDEDLVVTEHTGDIAAIELISHRMITIQIGTALTEIPHFTWIGE